MRKLLLAAFAALALLAPARAQTFNLQRYLDATTIGSKTPAPGTFTVEQTQPVITHAAPTTILGADNDVVSDLVVNPNSQAVEMGRFSQIVGIFDGGEITGTGHIIGLAGQATAEGLTGVPLEIGVEAFTQIQAYGGIPSSVVTAAGVVTHMIGNCATCSIGTYYDFFPTDLLSNAGTIGTAINYECPNYGIMGIGTVNARVCLNNDDPLKPIKTQGQVINSTGQELGPTAGVQAITGRYYYGVQRGGSTGNVVAVMNTLTFFAPLQIAARTTFTKIGVNITTAATGGACSLSVYDFENGEPIGAPLVTGAVSAAATGPVEAAISTQLDAGIYVLGIQCNSNAVDVGGYTENALPTLFGTGTSDTSVDDAPILSGMSYGTWPSSPTLLYAATSTYTYTPRVWLRR